MATKKNFLLLSLDDDKAKKIANAINNTSCKKILDFLAENEATETEISEKLKMPISSVHYNLKQLMDAKLITWDKYHYSEKGKEVKHYTVANKYIVIAPKGESAGLAEKLKSILPTGLIVLLGAAFVHIFSSPKETLSMSNQVAPDMARGVGIMAEEATSFGAQNAPEAVMIATEQQSLWQSIISNYAFWFLFGALFALFVFWAVKKVLKK